MSAAPEIVVDDTADALAADVAGRTVAVVGAALAERSRASLVLTGGGILEKVFAALVAHPDVASVDWSQVEVFWGDERFVAADSDDRNDLPVERLLIARLPFDPARVHRMPSTEGPDGEDVVAAAARYAALLAGVRTGLGDGDDEAGDASVPPFDVVLLGMGPDGHCCSLFPGHPALQETGLTVVGVTGSPKPPPIRLTLSFRALAAAQEIWVIASGEGKADAVAQALTEGDREKTPVAGARGRRRTLWLLDRDAASKLHVDGGN